MNKMRKMRNDKMGNEVLVTELHKRLTEFGGKYPGCFFDLIDAARSSRPVEWQTNELTRSGHWHFVREDKRVRGAVVDLITLTVEGHGLELIVHSPWADEANDDLPRLTMEPIAGSPPLDLENSGLPHDDFLDEGGGFFDEDEEGESESLRPAVEEDILTEEERRTLADDAVGSAETARASDDPGARPISMLIMIPSIGNANPDPDNVDTSFEARPKADPFEVSDH